MKKYVYKLKGLLFISVIFSVINAVINAAMLLFPGLLIDNYKKGLPYIQKMLFIYALIFIGYMINAYFYNRAADYRRILFEKAIKKDFFTSAIEQNYKSFHSWDVGEYISLQTNDIAEMCMNYMNPLFFILDSMVMIIIYHQIMIMVITGFLVLHAQSTSAGTLVYYIFVTNLIIEKSRSIEGNLYRFMKNMAAFENIDSILNEAEVENEDGEELSDISEISFDKVGLVYENAARVFSDRSFTLKKGDAVLLKGGNGCGKSSTLKMIAGFLAPSEGDIRYNGISYKKLKRQSLYRNICYLNQEELLLNETLPEYISIMAHRDVSEKEYQTYASKVNLTKDYGRIIDNGKSFSGGEKKKAIIMKLLARKQEVSVILLDEIEAGLD